MATKKRQISTGPASRPQEAEQFTNEKSLHIWWRIMTGVTAAYAIFSITYFWLAKPWSTGPGTLAVVVSWLLGPPFWFLFENTVLIKKEDVLKKDRMTRFKLGQDSAKLFWFGIAALIFHLARLLPQK